MYFIFLLYFITDWQQDAEWGAVRGGSGRHVDPVCRQGRPPWVLGGGARAAPARPPPPRQWLQLSAENQAR